MGTSERLPGLAGDDRGSLLIPFALMSVVIVGFVGVAIDGTRWQSMRSQHATAIDGALLAGARHLTLHPGDLTGTLAAAQTFYTANLRHAGDVVENSVTFVTTDNDQSVTFSGTASVKTTFLQVLGVSSLPIAKPAKATTSTSGYSGSNLEIAMMLDVTGSMCDDGVGPCTSSVKLDGLKAATTNLADIVLGQASSTYTSRIALVPFARDVRIDVNGSSNPLMQTLTGRPQTWSGWYNDSICTGGTGYNNGEIWVWTIAPTCTDMPTYHTGWQMNPCVMERWFDTPGGFNTGNGGLDAGDSAPGANNWLTGQGGDRFPLSWDSTDTPWNSVSPNASGQSAAYPTGQWSYSPTGSDCEIKQGNEIVPLTDDLSKITGKVNTLEAYGPTAGALGTVWTQYMLSPKWSNVWGSSSAPGSYADTKAMQSSGAPVLRKVAVLLTDGGYNTARSTVIPYAYDNGVWMQTVSNYAVQACTNMKNNGIEIYTVGFNLDALSTGERAIATATLKACGSDIQHFYNSINVQQLQQAFTDIATKMTPVRLVQ